MYKMYCDECGTVNYVGYKDMLKESGVIPCPKIQDFKVDLIYSKYSVKQGKDVIMSINEERFRDMLIEIAGLKFPWLERQEALI